MKALDTSQATTPTLPLLNLLSSSLLLLRRSQDFGKAMSYVSSDTNTTMSEDPSKEEDIEENEKYPVREILKVGRHTQMTTAGRVYSFSALVLLGTGKGTAGLGYGRGTTVAEVRYYLGKVFWVAME